VTVVRVKSLLSEESFGFFNQVKPDTEDWVHPTQLVVEYPSEQMGLLKSYVIFIIGRWFVVAVKL